eukprot:1158427-Pelagomonas_calceolata.AAC.3
MDKALRSFTFTGHVRNYNWPIPYVHIHDAAYPRTSALYVCMLRSTYTETILIQDLASVKCHPNYSALLCASERGDARCASMLHPTGRLLVYRLYSVGFIISLLGIASSTSAAGASKRVGTEVMHPRSPVRPYRCTPHVVGHCLTLSHLFNWPFASTPWSNV